MEMLPQDDQVIWSCRYLVLKKGGKETLRALNFGPSGSV